MRPQKTLSAEDLDKKERKIASGAQRATLAAFRSVLQRGGNVLVAKDGKLVLLDGNGKKTIVDKIAPRVKKEKMVYRFEWTPPSQD